MDIDNFPKISEVKRSITKLQKINFPIYIRESNVEDFVKRISDIIENEFGFIPNFKQIFKNNKFNKVFFRARELESISNINLIREHSYPPIDVAGMGRCNFHKLPVFYCSDNAFVAFAPTPCNPPETL